MLFQVIQPSPVGWARFLCLRGFKAVAFEWWAEKHCPPYNLIEIRTKAVIRIYKPMTATGRLSSFNTGKIIVKLFRDLILMMGETQGFIDSYTPSALKTSLN